MTRKYLILLIFIFLILSAGIIYAHSGRTDSYGCHTCRTNCPSWGLSYGEYHCHRAKTLPQPEPPVRSHYDSPEGYTEPAPDYETPIEAKNSRSFTAQASTEDNQEISIWWWIIGIGFIVYIFYKFKK